MNVEVHLKDQSQPVVHTDVRNAYQKGSLYCVLLNSGRVYKYPIGDMFRTIEDPSAT